MLLAISLWIKNIAGWVVLHWRLVLTIIGAITLIICVALISRSCKSQPKLDEKEIQGSIKAIEQKNDQKLKEILANSDVRIEQIDANLANAKAATVNAMHDARKKYENMTTEELAAEIERRSKQ